jgi:4-amino-4-deoxy-L-arabinose transferase-like glycosyltransferase
VSKAVGTATRRTTAVAVAIVGLAAVLRLAGITAGLPHRLANDEPFVLGTALRMMQSGDFNPHFFDYGGFTIYLQLLVGSASFMAGTLSGTWSSLDQYWQGELAGPARTVTALLGVLTVWIVYRAASRWGQPIALIAAAALAVQTEHVRDSHFALTDVPLTLMVAVTWLLSVRAVEDGRGRAFFWAGIGAGLAAATKYTGGLALVMPLVATIGLPASAPRPPRAAAAIGGSAVGFLLASPYTVLALPEFLNGFANLAQSYNLPVSFGTVALTYLKHMRNWFSWSGVLSPQLGWLALAVCLVGIGAIIRGCTSRLKLAYGAVLLVFPVAYFLLLANQGSLIYGRYLLPLTPMLSVSVAAGIVSVARRIGGENARRGRRATVLLLLLLLAPLGSSIAWDLEHRKTSTVDQAAAWILDNVDTTEPVVTEAMLYLPPSYQWQSVTRLTDREVDSYREAGVRYLLASTAVTEVEPPTYRPNRTRLSRATRIVQVFAPTDSHPGPTITVMRVDEPR